MIPFGKGNLLIAVIALLAAYAFFKPTWVGLRAQSLPVLTLNTTPDRVRLTLNGTKLFDGKFVLTPFELPIKRGNHTLKISRPGFETQIVNLHVIDNEPIRLENVFLGKSQDFKPAQVRFTMPGIVHDVIANVDFGYIEERMPFIADDLERGTTHTVIFDIDTKPDKMLLTCEFTIPVQQTTPVILELKQNKNGYKIAGCQPPAQ